MLCDVRVEYARAVCEAAAVRSTALQRSLAAVPREQFVGDGPWMVVEPAAAGALPRPRLTPDGDPRHLYRDLAVALDPSRGLYNGAPGLIVPVIDTLSLASGGRAFHVGAGAGYYTAVLAELVGTTGHVIAAEIDDTLRLDVHEPDATCVVHGDVCLSTHGSR